MNFIFPKPKIVVFDLFGTLVQFGIKKHPYRTVLQWARQQGRAPRDDDARILMTHPGSIVEVLETMGINPPSSIIEKMQLDINEELESLALFDDVVPVLNGIIEQGMMIAICSNLAKPYGEVLKRLLPDAEYVSCMSYDIGFIKPDKQIYQWIVDNTQVKKEECLFIGDTKLADYDGPLSFGFNARLLLRNGATKNSSISTLMDVFNCWK